MPSKPSTAIQRIIFAFKKQNCYIRRCSMIKKKIEDEVSLLMKSMNTV